MICRECREKVLYGWREGSPGWLHREEKDHPGFPIVEPEYDPPPVIPEPEIRAEPFDAQAAPPRSGLKQVVNLLTKTDGWDLTSATYARGPLVGAKGHVLRAVDSHAIKAKGQTGLDGRTPVAVALWYDMKFELAYVGFIDKGRLEPVRTNSNGLKSFIKTGEIIAVAAPDSEE